MRPRVTVLTTGDELQEPGEPLRPGAIRNSNAYSVAALVERSGAELLGAEIVADDREATRAALGRGARRRRRRRLRRRLGRRARPRAPGARRARGRAGLLAGRAAPRRARPTSAVRGQSGARSSSACPATRSRRWSPSCSSRARRSGRCSARPTSAARRRRCSPAEQPALAARTQLVRCRLELARRRLARAPDQAQGSHVLTSMLGADALAIVPAAERPAGRAARRSRSSC